MSNQNLKRIFPDSIPHPPFQGLGMQSAIGITVPTQVHFAALFALLEVGQVGPSLQAHSVGNSQFKGTVSILTLCFYGLGLKKRVDLLVRKPVLHFLNATKQNYEFLKFCAIKQKTWFVYEMKCCAGKNIKQRIGAFVYQHFCRALCASYNLPHWQSAKIVFRFGPFA